MSKTNNKSLFARIKAAFEEDVNTADNILDIKAADGNLYRVESSTLEVGSVINEIIEGELVPVEESSIELEDGTVLTIELVEGVSTIKEITAKSEEDEQDVVVEFKVAKRFFNKTKAKFETIAEVWKWELEVDVTAFEVGQTVLNEGYPVASGVYELEDGRTITIGDEGVIVLITDAEGIVVDAPEVGEEAPTEQTSGDVEELLESLLEEFKKLKKDFKLVKNDVRKINSASFTEQKIIASENSEKTNKIKNKFGL
jgi:hypothetical protein